MFRSPTEELVIRQKVGSPEEELVVQLKSCYSGRRGDSDLLAFFYFSTLYSKFL